MRNALDKGTTDYEDGSVKIHKSSVREVALNGSQIGPALKGPQAISKINALRVEIFHFDTRFYNGLQLGCPI